MLYNNYNHDYLRSVSVEDLKKAGYIFHHEASCQGYVSRKADAKTLGMPYHGRFGDGWKVFYPRFDTSSYCWVHYYIKGSDTK